jgi:hypothetical protein
MLYFGCSTFGCIIQYYLSNRGEREGGREKPGAVGIIITDIKSKIWVFTVVDFSWIDLVIASKGSRCCRTPVEF